MKYVNSRELAYCGLFGAAALLLPTLFHLVHLGRVFMPMYLPLMALAFFVRPVPAAITAAVVPVLSAALTGMPPFFPPVAFTMVFELAVMGGLVAWLRQRFPMLHELVVLVPVLVLGRVLYVASVYVVARLVELPPKFLAGVSLLSGWPGVVLMIVVVPFVARVKRSIDRDALGAERP